MQHKISFYSRWWWLFDISPEWLDNNALACCCAASCLCFVYFRFGAPSGLLFGMWCPSTNLRFLPIFGGGIGSSTDVSLSSSLNSLSGFSYLSNRSKRYVRSRLTFISCCWLSLRDSLKNSFSCFVRGKKGSILGENQLKSKQNPHKADISTFSSTLCTLLCNFRIHDCCQWKHCYLCPFRPQLLL